MCKVGTTSRGRVWFGAGRLCEKMMCGVGVRAMVYRHTKGLCSWLRPGEKADEWTESNMYINI